MQNVVVYVRGGDVTKALRVFKKACERERIKADAKAKDFYMSRGEKRRLKRVRARIRHQKYLAKGPRQWSAII
jgi:ribosomal protein S21